MNQLSKLLLLSVSCQVVFLPLKADDDETLVNLKSIELSSGGFDKGLSSEPIQIGRNLDIPGNSAVLVRELNSYLNEPLTLNKIEEIKYTITRFFEKNHHPIVMVVTPPQDVTTGNLRLVVIEGKVGEIQLRGNRWTSDAHILHGIHLHPGDTINAYQLKQTLAWLNRTPFRVSDVVFVPGKGDETTDVKIVTKERFPLQPYVGMDNTGTAFTERTRLYGGFNAGNLWGADHRFSYQFTTALNWQSLSAHSGSYTMPFPWKHQFLAFGGWSRGRGDLQSSMKNEAVAWQASGRYQIPISPIFGNFLQEFAFGYDFKKTNNSLLFGGVRVAKTSADTNQFMLSYMLDYNTAHSKTSFLLEFYGSPFIMTEHQKSYYYDQIRPYAKPKYGYARSRLSETYTFRNRMEFKWSFVTQWTAWNLLPNEMMGLGGWDTVRGYDERTVNVDQALLSSIELRAPSFHVINKKDKMQFLAFFDYATGAVKHKTEAQRKSHWLAGTGFGVRYNLKTNCYLRADLGFPLHHTGYGLHTPHLHVGGTLSY